MRIKKIDGTFFETDEYPDIAAELFERAKDFYDFCHKYRIPTLCKFIDPQRRKVGGWQHLNQNNKEEFGVLVNSMIQELEQWLDAKIEIHYNNEGEEWKNKNS